MRRAVLLALLVLAAPARASWFVRPLIDPLAGTKTLFEAEKYPEVIAQLSPESMQKLNREALQRAYLYLGTSYERTGKLGEALSTLQLAVKLFPKDINLLSELGYLLHASGLDEQAQPLFEEVLHIHPNNARAHLGLAEIDHSLGFLDRSALHYARVLEIWSDRATLWRDYAEVLLAERDPKTAEPAIRKALALAPDIDSTIDLSFILRAQGRLPEAIAALDDVLKEHPERQDVALMRSLWCLEAERWSEASAGAQARLTADPTDALAHWISARVYLHEDRSAEAAKELRGAAAASQTSPFTAAAAQALLIQLEGHK